jgi:hypothetical protein
MKFGLYTKNTRESSQHITTVDISSKAEAEAYFAGRKSLTLTQFHNLFIVKEIHNTNSKNLLLG